MDAQDDYPIDVKVVGTSDVNLIRDSSSGRYALHIRASWDEEE